jgi:hypothetical protein
VDNFNSLSRASRREVAAGVASSVLLLEEARKLGLFGWERFRADPVFLALNTPPP